MTPSPRNSQTSTNGADDVDVNLVVDDETLDELTALNGEAIVGIAVWEDSVAQALDAGELTDSAVDLDVYLESGVFFELYGVLCYPDLDSEPLSGTDAIDRKMAVLVAAGLALEDIAVDTEDSLVLVLGNEGEPLLYLNAGAWRLDEWEELPDHVHTA